MVTPTNSTQNVTARIAMIIAISANSAISIANKAVVTAMAAIVAIVIAK